jgi:quinohemoprotein ethanol dehydrogenase
VGFCATALASLLCVGSAAAQTSPDLTKPAGAQWLTIGGDWHNSRYSTLKQITTDNVKQLKAAWAVHLGSGLGLDFNLEATPIVQDGVMYVSSGNDDVVALDAKTGALIWEHLSKIDQNISTVCCGWDNRGVAIGDGKVFIGQLDGNLVALDQHNGKEVWRTQVGRWQDGYTITSAPLYYNGAVYTGISGGDRGVRGKLTALDAKTGKELWHFWTAPGPGDVGGDTWPSPNDPNPARAQAYLHGGGTVWQTPAVDPELGLLYFSTSNPGPGVVASDFERPGDNLFSSSIVALHLDGTYAWHFQAVHHDLWDFDLPSPVVLFDQLYNGQMRKVIAEAGKTGWVYILDRTNGKPLIGVEEKPVEQLAKASTAPTQPYPVGDAFIPQCPPELPGWVGKCIFGTIGDTPVLMAPLIAGGTNWANMAYSPDTGYLYVSASVRPFSRVLKGSPNTAGPPIGIKYSGTYTAIDPHTNKIVWQNKTPYPIGQGSGTLATAGGLLFHGEPDGHVQALDAKTGTRLWQWQTGAGADAPAVTYEVDGVQYVAIASGGISHMTQSANGDMVWAFSLEGSPGNRLGEFPPPKPPATGEEFSNAPGGRPDEFPIRKASAVNMVEYSFAPLRITVSTGTEVTFTNNGTKPHNAAGDGGWDTGLVSPGHSAAVRFDKPGTYTYRCTPDPAMVGQIIVTGAAVPDAKAVAVVTKPGDLPGSALPASR